MLCTHSPLSPYVTSIIPPSFTCILHVYTTPSYPPVTHTSYPPVTHTLPPFPSTMLYPSHSFPYTHPPSSHSLPIYTHHTPSTQCSVGLYAVIYLCFHRWPSRSRYLVSIDDNLYEQDKTVLTTDDKTVTITNDIAIATIVDVDGEL